MRFEVDAERAAWHQSERLVRTPAHSRATKCGLLFRSAAQEPPSKIRCVILALVQATARPLALSLSLSTQTLTSVQTRLNCHRSHT